MRNGNLAFCTTKKFAHGSQSLADKCSMAFDITIAYAVTLFAVNSLAYLAVRNHRSGWRRERSNAFLDILITWANAKAEMRSPQESTGSIAGTTIEPDLLTQQLSALQ